MASKNTKLKSIRAIVGVLATVVGLITAYPTLRAMYDEHVLEKPPLVPGTNAILMSLEDYKQRQLKLRHDIEAELQEAHQEDRARLQAELDAVNARLADLPEAYDEALKRIKALEAQLAALEGQVSDADLAEARAALHQGNLRKAQTLFEQVLDAQDKSIKLAAGAEYGLGQIAEAENRWHDASTHYSNAARLDPSFENLFKARQYAWRAGQFAAAHRHGEALLGLARKDGTQEQLAVALNEHALTVKAQGRYDEAEGLYREALEIDRTTLGEGHPEYATHLNNLALVVQAQGRHAEAEGLFREALEITRATIGEGHPYYAIHLSNLASVVEAQGRYAEAAGLYREALAIDRATIGEGHPEYAKHLNNLAGVVRAQGRYAEAEELYREALEIDLATIGEGHPNYAIHLNNLAGVVEDQGRYAEAEGLYREALEIHRATIGEGHPDYATHLNNLALVVQTQGRSSEAEGIFREALEIGRATIGEGHPDYATRLNNLAGVLVEQGKPEEARPLYEQALTIFRATLPPDHPHIGVVEGHIAKLP